MIGLKELSVSMANTWPTNLILGEKGASIQETPINDPPSSNGNKVLQKTRMPWILPLDVPVPGLPWLTTKELPLDRKGGVSNVAKRDTWAGIAQIGQVKPKEEAKEEDTQIKQVMAEELVHLVWNMSQEEKDKVIQDVFMKDFWNTLTWRPGGELSICSSVTLCI